MRSPLKLCHPQAEKPSLPQPLLMEKVLQPNGQAGVHPWSLPQFDVFPVLEGGEKLNVLFSLR